MNDIVLFNETSQLPAFLQGEQTNLGKNLIVGGEGGNRIGLKGARFRIIVAGKEENVRDENYLDVHIVGVVPHYSRIYYKDAYSGEKARPTCYSADGKAPPVDLETRMHSACESCPMNQVGSKVDGGKKYKACSYFQRLVVTLAGDPEFRKFRLDVKAQGLFGDSKKESGKYNVRDYAQFVANRGADVGQLVTRLSFDTDSSTPKLLFSAHRFVTAAEWENVKQAVVSDEVKHMLEVNMSTVDLSGEQTSEETKPATQSPAGVQAAPVTKQEAAAAQTAPAPAPPAPAKTDAPKKYKPVPEKLGEYTVQQYLDSGWTKEQLVAEGMIVEVVEAPPAPPKPAPAPKPPAPPAPPKPAAPKAPPVVQETATDTELDDIIAGLV